MTPTAQLPRTRRRPKGSFPLKDILLILSAPQAPRFHSHKWAGPRLPARLPGPDSHRRAWEAASRTRGPPARLPGSDPPPSGKLSRGVGPSLETWLRARRRARGDDARETANGERR